MYPQKFTSLLIFIANLLFVPSAFSQDTSSTLEPPTSTVKPLASLTEFAAKNGIPLSQVELRESNAEPQKGDCVTLLVTLFQGPSHQQWLTIVKQDNLTNDELRLELLSELKIYSSTGRVLHFKNTRTVLNASFIGPFTENGSAPEEQLHTQLKSPYRKVVSSEQINFGLDRYGETAIALTKRCDAAGVKMNSMYHIGDSDPLSDKQLEKGKRFVNLVHPTEEEELVIFSVANALNAFLSAALEIDDFSVVVENVLEKPSIWKVVSQFGLRRFLKYDVSTVRPVDARYLGVKQPAYEMPLQLFFNDNLALQAAIIMTASKPPLQTCAGIIEVYAEHPADRSKRLVIQLIAGRREK